MVHKIEAGIKTQQCALVTHVFHWLHIVWSMLHDTYTQSSTSTYLFHVGTPRPCVVVWP